MGNPATFDRDCTMTRVLWKRTVSEPSKVTARDWLWLQFGGLRQYELDFKTNTMKITLYSQQIKHKSLHMLTCWSSFTSPRESRHTTQDFKKLVGRKVLKRFQLMLQIKKELSWRAETGRHLFSFLIAVTLEVNARVLTTGSSTHATISATDLPSQKPHC